MPSGSAGRRYAQAIFDLAKQDDKLDQWAADLAGLSYAFSKPDVQNYLENPKTGRESKVSFVSGVLSNEVSPEALRLAQLLVQRNRQNDLPTINTEFTKMWNRLRGIEIAEVTTAVPVSPEEEAVIRDKLSAMTNKQITVEMKVDPSIIGGVVARVGDTLIDGSVRTRLQNLRKQLA